VHQRVGLDRQPLFGGGDRFEAGLRKASPAPASNTITAAPSRRF
jgi:hypothetical protein